MKERRQHRRFEVEIPVTLRTQGRFIPAVALDISSGGICLLADFNEEIPEGPAEVVMDLNMELKDVALQGQVLRHHKSIGQKVAIQFTNPSSAHFRSLERFLASRFN